MELDHFQMGLAQDRGLAHGTKMEIMQSTLCVLLLPCLFREGV